jgi:hypothetical protein
MILTAMAAFINLMLENLFAGAAEGVRHRAPAGKFIFLRAALISRALESFLAHIFLG